MTTAPLIPQALAAPAAEDAELETYARVHRLPLVGWTGIAIAAVFVVMAVAAPFLAHYGVNEISGKPLEAPSWAHPLGTTLIGQDVAASVLFGARTALFYAVVAGGATVLIGAFVGMIAGWSGGRTDAVIMRIVDVFLVVPGLPLLVVLGAYAGRTVLGTAVIIALISWPFSARVIRSQVLSLRRRPYLEAAVNFGAPTHDVLRRHVVPEIALITAAAFVGAAGRAVMFVAGLAFLGLGDPLTADWGKLMAQALSFRGIFYSSAWEWWLVPPIGCIVLLLLGLTLIGLAVESRVNPRIARHVA